MKTLLKLASVTATIASAVLMTAAAAYATPQCDMAFYDHNGSEMAVHVCDGEMVIEYENPRKGISAKSGTVLFRGEMFEMTGGSKINGRARVFRRGCKPASYEVNGWMENGTITMAGRAPVRGSDCKVRRYRNDKLLFRGL
ncbi:hypothetical protein [Ahrensia sp. R2A130]|uniref:hypothetical protein n=1 Tax=Ahrensia sp. R2A130 TaxID=744979 RepID=UPI0001E09CC6|nr:hypothetical protein [Ahrensia sp. R2A130]EFL88222.1 conserved hypothetical protein [Ahrensia sp. R2A130]